MSLLGSSPTVGRPTRRIRESCLSDSSGISEKSIFFDFVFFSFFPARATCADNTRDFFIFIVSSPDCVRYDQDSSNTTFCQAQAPLFAFGMFNVFTVQTGRIKKRCGGFFE